MNIIIFFFEQTKMRYINKSFVPLAQEVPKETKQSYNKVPIKTEKENKKSKSANPQINKGTLPPHMNVNTFQKFSLRNEIHNQSVLKTMSCI